jgi:two-component system OmpR family response regulator
VRALVRGAGGGATLMRHGPLAFDQVGRIAYLNEQMLDLSAREVGLLKSCSRAAGGSYRRSSSSITCANGARKSATTRSRCMCTACARRSRLAASASPRARLGYCLEKYQPAVAAHG